MNHETAPSGTSRKRYDEEFKRSAVQHRQTSGKSAAQVARELGLNAGTLQQWKKRWGAEAPAPGLRTVAELEAENRRLRRELHQVVQQRDILKKTLGILSAPPESVLNGSER
jgi:transposase-like protein